MEFPMKGSLSNLCKPIPKDNNKDSSASPTSPSPSTSPSLTSATSPSNKTTTTKGASGNLSSPNSLTKFSALGGGQFPSANNHCLLATGVIPFLDETSLVSLMRTCKRLREVACSDDVWEPRLKDMRVNTLLINRTSNFFRAFRSEIITLRGLEGFYDFESEESESDRTGAGAPVSAVKRVLLTISPAFLGFVTPVARVALIVQYHSLSQEDVFEGTMRYSFPKRLFVVSTYLTRCPRQEGPRFDVVVAKSVRKWGTQKLSHFESVRGGTRLIISISQQAQSPANGYLPSSELLTVSRIPRDGEGVVFPLPSEIPNTNNSSTSPSQSSSNLMSSNPTFISGDSNKSSGGVGGDGKTDSGTSSTNSSPPTSERRFSFRSLLGRG